MPSLSYSIELTCGGDNGELRYRAPGPNESFEFWTKWSLSFKDKLEDMQEIARRVNECHRFLGALCVYSLEGEWEGYDGSRLTPKQASKWADDYPLYAQALGESIHARYWPMTDQSSESTGGDATEPDPTQSSD